MDNLVLAIGTSGKKARVPQLSRASFRYLRRPGCLGSPVQVGLESVSSFPWNRCPVSRGIGVHIGVEYAQTLIDAGADYVLALKDNHPTWCADVQLWLETEVAGGRLPVLETVAKDHGRIEIRRYALSHQIDWLEAKPDWAGLQAVGRVESTRIIGENTRTECRYFLCSLVERDRFAATVRQHWASKTNSTGSWTCNLAKMPVGRAPTTRRKTWP